MRAAVVGTVGVARPAAPEAIRDGTTDFTIDQRPYPRGRLPVAFLTENAEHHVLPTGTVRTGPLFVTEKDAARVIDLAQKGIR